MQTGGKAFRYGDNVNTDVIIPARYLNTSNATALAAHCMEDIDADFAGSVSPGDVVVAGENFGCGSSREHAPLAIKTCGVSCVIAKSFARIFYRNAINIGLAIIECPAAVDGIEAGDSIRIDFDKGVVYNKTRETKYAAQPFPPFLRRIIQAGGLLRAIREEKA